MIARTHYRLTAVGACLLLAANLSAASDALPRQPSPHFFPGRILRSKAADVVESPAPANLQVTPQPPTFVAPSDRAQSAPPPVETPLQQEAPPILETRS